jgi:HEAT repeat protein
MPGKRKFEEQIAALDALRDQPEDRRTEPLRKALTGKNNFIAAKSADLIREFNLAELTLDLLTAFDHFFENPEKTDPQCWAKNAISRALATFELQDADVFLRGMRHIQLEPVWGGSSDTAGTLRATCALALVQCRSLTEAELLKYLIDLLADKDKAVRVEIVRAIAQLASTPAALLLRARAVVGADEPEVLGACYAGVLSIEGTGAIPWVSRFLAAGDDAAAEAALAIAGTHSPQAFDALKECLEKAKFADPWFRSVVLSAIALTRQEAAHEFLLDLVLQESMDAEPAIEALMRSLPSNDVIERLEKLVTGNARLQRTFAANRKTSG